jgi:hypothetical protein
MPTRLAHGTAKQPRNKARSFLKTLSPRAPAVELHPEDLQEIDTLASQIEVQGARCSGPALRMINR